MTTSDILGILASSATRSEAISRLQDAGCDRTQAKSLTFATSFRNDPKMGSVEANRAFARGPVPGFLKACMAEVEARVVSEYPEAKP